VGVDVGVDLAVDLYFDLDLELDLDLDLDLDTDLDSVVDVDVDVNLDVDVNVDVDVDVDVDVEPERLKNEIIVQEPDEGPSFVLNLSETKTINLFEDMVEPRKVNYDKLTVKELKEMAAKLSAPASLKTKKELIDFLEKK